jgi:hypothetical protein
MKRFDHSTLRDVDQRMMYVRIDHLHQSRRLIYCSYVSKLTPEFVKSLAKTAWHHQMDALRDAIWKHIALETSLRVHAPVSS